MQDVLWYSICIATRSLIWLIGSQCIVFHCFRNPNGCKCSQKHPLCSRQNHLGPEWWTGSKQIEKKFKHTPVPTLWGNPDLGILWGVKNAMWLKPGSQHPPTHAQRLSATWVLFGKHIFCFFLDPTTCGYRMWKHSQCCMAHLAQSALGTEYAMLLLLFDTPFPGLKKHYNWYGVIVLPIGF